jgi:catechol 2,3-dioxygenase-like lactoylglutathione lyase family enzyme
VAQQERQVQSQITFFYYDDLDAASEFYGDVMGFRLVEDQKWAKIYRASGGAYVGIVAGEKGFHQAQDENAVLLTLLVDDVAAWYEYLQTRGVKIVTELQEKEDIQVRCFFLEDPGGYSIEIQRFLLPELAKIFHQDD